MGTFSDFFAAAGIPALMDAHGETVTYQPVGGGSSRSISAAISTKQEIMDGEEIEYEEERIRVFVRRDALTGIERPQIRDTIKRNDDWRQELYSFSGKVIDETPDSWTLEFTRPKPTTFGTAFRRES